MSINNWIGQAPAVAQVSTVTVASTAIGDVYTITAGGQSIRFTTTTTVVADAVAGLVAAWAAATGVYFTTVAATNTSPAMTLTARTAGVPFTVTVSATGTGTLTLATPTASSGPNDWSTAANWSTGAVPVSSDSVYIENTANSILWGLDQHTVTLTALNVSQSFTGLLGLASNVFALTATTASSAAMEYRPTYLKVSATTINIGYYAGTGAATGSSRIKINTGTVATTVNVSNAGRASENALKTVRLLGVNSSNVLNVSRGAVALAGDMPGEVSTYATVNVSYVSNPVSDSDVYLSNGVTVVTLNGSGGSLVAACAATNVNISNGTCILAGTGAYTTITTQGGTTTVAATGGVTTLNLTAGTLSYLGTGTLGTSYVRGILDLSADPRAKTLTTITLYAGATLKADNGVHGSITFTNPITLARCGDEDVTLTLGKNITLAPVAL